jgi:hypothetical protein
MRCCETVPRCRQCEGDSSNNLTGRALQDRGGRPQNPVMLKFLLLILLIAAVWYGWRYVNRKPVKKSPGDAPPTAQPPVAKTIAEDLKPCPVCGTYMVANPNQPPGQTCGRPDCRPA